MRTITRKNILDTDIYCLTGEKFSLGRSNIEVVREMLDAGVRLIQYREKEKKAGAKLDECRAIREMTREVGASFIVNDDIDIADWSQVEWAMAPRFQGSRDLVVEHAKGSSLDPSADPETRETTKMGFDLTIPRDRNPDHFKRPDLPLQVDLDDYL